MELEPSRKGCEVEQNLRSIERERVVPFPFQVKSSYFSNSLFLSTSVIKKNYSSCPDFRSLQHGM